jgi:hypothetical protein
MKSQGKLKCLTAFAALLLFGGTMRSGAQRPSTSSSPSSCEPQGEIGFVCGLVNVEDFLPILKGKYLLGTSYKDSSVGMYLIDTASKTAKPVLLSVATKRDPIYSDCPGPPDLTKLVTHGLDVKTLKGGTYDVYLVNHGTRESIEVFQFEAAKNTAKWIGCVIEPAGSSGNAVVSLPDRSILFTKFYDTEVADANIAAVLQGKTTGRVYHWVPGRGIRAVPGSDFSGDNGLLVAANGDDVFINAYGSYEVWRISLSGKSPPSRVKVDFSPDNLRWAPDGSIFVTGQYMKDAKSGQPHDWGVARLQPKTMTVSMVLREPGSKSFDNATSAVQIGDTLWIGTFGGDRVAYVKMPISGDTTK